MGWQQEPIGKARVIFFVKIIYATSMVYFFLQLFYSLYIQQHPLKRLALIN